MIQSPRSSRHSIDTGYLHLILRGVERTGVDISGVLRRAGVDPYCLDPASAQISRDAFTRILTALTRVSGDEFWGIGDHPIKAGTFQTMCRLVAREKTLGSALRTGLAFYHRTTNDFILRLAIEEDEARIWAMTRIDDPLRSRVILGASLFFTYGMMCLLIGRTLSLDTVHYSFAEQEFSSGLYPFYDAPVFFGQARNELRFRRELLNAPVMLDEDRLYQFMASMPGALLARYRDDSSFPERVRALLRHNLSRHSSLDETAIKLAVSPQTLRRRLLDSEGLGFQELKDQVRRDVATRLLRSSRISIEEIALHVGFSELSTFHRAFRRWTGQTPGNFRRESVGASKNEPSDSGTGS